jgi:DNA-directed RNA polymerase specialized sigma subunit
MSLDDVFTDFITRIRAGDHTAAEELVRTYEPVVRREIRLNMTDRRMARMFDSVDICQSIWSSFFVRVAAGQFDLENPGQLSRLLLAMAKNKLAWQSRHNRFQKRDVGRIDAANSPIETVSDQHPSPSDCVSARELFSKMQSSLSDEERKISELRRAGLAWEEVAMTLGGTAQARRMQLDRAADRVTRQLGLED